MKPFAYARPKDQVEALSLLSPTARPKGGGIDLLDLAKNGVSTLDMLVDLRHLGYRSIDVWDTKVSIGGGVSLDAIGGKQLLKFCPSLSDAALAAATPLIRNRATLAGSLLQRPRCAYFRDPFFECLKRGGKTCPAMEGDHSEGAIFGNGRCCAVHPSNMAVALLALGATAEVLTGVDDKGELKRRNVSLDGAFFVAPEEDPLREARIESGELIDSISFSPAPASAYVEVDQKQSFDWASASAAVVLRLEGGKVTEARVALGHVAPVPILSEAAAKALIGKVPDEAAATAAAEAAVKGATPLRDNGHKVQHLKVCVKRAVLKAAERGR
jgi:xanthine dehydrogenase YagS FAD-binding subunit